MPTNLVELFVYIGTPAFLSLIISNVLTHLDWWNGLTGEQKSLGYLGLSILFGVGSYLLQTYVPTGATTALQPFWLIVANAINLWLSGQATYFFGRRLAAKAPPKAARVTKRVLPTEKAEALAAA